MIGQQNDHDVIFLKMFARILQRTVYRGTTAPTYKQSFLTRQSARHDSAILICNFYELVDHVKVYILWKDVFSESFCEIRIHFIFIEDARFFILLKYRAVGIDA